MNTRVSTDSVVAQHDRPLRIAVLGGTGLIGTQIVAALSAAGPIPYSIVRATRIQPIATPAARIAPTRYREWPAQRIDRKAGESESATRSRRSTR